MPTPTASKASRTYGRRRSWSRYSARRTGSGPRSCSGSPIPEPSKRVRRYCSCSVTPTTGRAGRRSPTLYAPSGSASTARPRRQGGDGLERVDRHGLDGSGTCPGPTDWIAAAAECAGALLDLHLVDGHLRRASLGGAVGAPTGVLEDYAMLATGLLALYQQRDCAVARCGAAVARRHCRPLR